MSLFLLTFFVLYGGVHAYTFFKARRAFDFGAAVGFVLAVFMLAMVIAPILVRIVERRGFEELARFLAYTGYIWMGILFLFFSAAIFLDLYHLALFVVGKLLNRDLAAISLSPKTAFLVPVAWGLVTALYGYFEAKDVITEKVTIATHKLPPEVKKLTIVQISDVHLGLIVRKERLTRILEKVKAADPDILLSTGDLVDGQLNRLAGLAELLQEIRPRYGKFAITGNHEFYAGLKQSLCFTEEAGFRLLRGTSVTIDGLITIAGVDDPAAGWGYQSRHGMEKALLAGLPQDKFILFLKHRPAVERDSLGLFDLQLSGHVHKGQLFPFNLITYLFYPVKTGLSNYPQNSSLYVSRGTGTWGPPIRFLARPEVTVIELVNKNVR